MGITFLDLVFFTNEPMNNVLYEKCCINHRLDFRNSLSSPSCEAPYLSGSDPRMATEWWENNFEWGACLPIWVDGWGRRFLRKTVGKDTKFSPFPLIQSDSCQFSRVFCVGTMVEKNKKSRAAKERLLRQEATEHSLCGCGWSSGWSGSVWNQ